MVSPQHVPALPGVHAVAGFLTAETAMLRDAHSKACFSSFLNYLVLRSNKICIGCYKTKPGTTARWAANYASLQWYPNSRRPKEKEFYAARGRVLQADLSETKGRDASRGNYLQASAELLLARRG